MSEQPHPLEIRNLFKSYSAPVPGAPSVDAVKGVSFDLKPGEVFGLLGPNGAGKTSIISCIVTLEKPTSGQVKVSGYDVTVNPELTKPQIGYVPQEVINHGYFNVAEIMKFHSGFYGIRDNSVRIEALLKEMRLWDHRYKNVRQLSGGMKRRLMIAKALVHSPRLLLLDEPTAGVDIELRSQLWDFIKRLKNEGVSVLLTTHYLEEAEMLCERVGIIDKGELKLLGPTRSLIDKLTVRQVRVKYRGRNEPTQYSLAAGQTVGELFVEQRLDVQAIEDISIVEGTLEEAFRRVIYQ